jgi:hypothetical protein
MKFHHLAVAAAAAIGATSSFATTYDFHLSGSSALQKVIQQSITNNCSSFVPNKGKNGSAAAGNDDNADGQSQTLYVCTVSPTASWGAPYTGAGNIVNIYMNTQGSAYGVFPVANGTPIKFINAATCAANLCTGVSLVAPDAGVSDVEPTLFNDIANHPVDTTGGASQVPPFSAANPAPVGTAFPSLFAGQTVSSSSFASSSIAATQTFGLAVNDTLLAALQAEQGTTGVPTVSSSAFATIYAPNYSTGSIGNWLPLLPNSSAAVQNHQVNICTRLPGSGTRASAQAFFLQAPFSSYGQSFATAANDNTGDQNSLSDTISQNNAGTYEISEYDNSAAVIGCMTASTANSAYAIGLLSTDRASGGTTGYTFVNLDGSVPNTSAARFGKYQWVYEAYYQVSKTAADAPFANAFLAAFKTPANILALGGASLNGVMAAAANCPVVPYSGNAAEAAVCSHVSRSGNSRSALVYVKK